MTIRDLVKTNEEISEIIVYTETTLFGIKTAVQLADLEIEKRWSTITRCKERIIPTIGDITEETVVKKWHQKSGYDVLTVFIAEPEILI